MRTTTAATIRDRNGPRPTAPDVSTQMANAAYQHISRSHRARLKAAATIAARSNNLTPYRHGALVVNGGRVLGRGHNRQRNNPAQQHHNLSIHAEVDAIRSANPSRLVGATLYVARITPAGWLAMSAPCEDCAAAAREFGITTVIYTLDGGVALTTL